MRQAMPATVILLAQVGLSAASDAPVEVPRGTAAPTLDGVISAGESEGALKVQLSPAGTAWLKRDARGLYVGLKVGTRSMTSLALKVNDKVRVLHASASLATAEYGRRDDVWRPSRRFSFRCREGASSAADRKKFLEEEGWLGTTVGVGTAGEVELHIAQRLLGEGRLRLALVSYRVAPGPLAACAWPATVSDGTKDQSLLFGRCPELRLSPDTWALLEAKPESGK